MHWTADLFATKFKWMVHNIIISWSVLCENLIVFSMSRSQWRPNLRWIYFVFIYIISFVPLITKPRTTKWVYADNSTLTYIINRQATVWEGEGMFCCTRGRTLFFCCLSSSQFCLNGTAPSGRNKVWSNWNWISVRNTEAQDQIKQ